MYCSPDKENKEGMFKYYKGNIQRKGLFCVSPEGRTSNNKVLSQDGMVVQELDLEESD